MNKDGTQHDEVITIDKPQIEDMFSIYYGEFYFHYNYFVYSFSVVDYGNEAESYYKMVAIDLNNIDSEPTILFHYKKTDPEFPIFSGGGAFEIGGSKDKFYVATDILYECDLTTGNSETYKMDVDASILMMGGYMDGKMYYFDDSKSGKGMDLYFYDLASKTTTMANDSSAPFVNGGKLSSDYVFVASSKLEYVDENGNTLGVFGEDVESGLYIYKHNGELVKFIKEEYPVRQCYLFGDKLLAYENIGKYDLAESLGFPRYYFDTRDLDGHWKVIGKG